MVTEYGTWLLWAEIKARNRPDQNCISRAVTEISSGTCNFLFSPWIETLTINTRHKKMFLYTLVSIECLISNDFGEYFCFKYSLCTDQEIRKILNGVRITIDLIASNTNKRVICIRICIWMCNACFYITVPIRSTANNAEI
jgi:hypothetical protein